MTGRGRELAPSEQLAWATPKFPKKQVDWAGKALTSIEVDISTPDWDVAVDVINNWRSSHNYPLNTFQVTLRNKASTIDPACTVAQRIKRFSSIFHKLDRFPQMKLSQIQDIGGCRAILENVENVEDLVQAYQASKLRHDLRRVTNYIEKPKPSGYRGVHLLYSYQSDKDSKKDYNGLRIEMQIRSSLQHAWATAVETVGTVTKQVLKSSFGKPEWLRFFALMGSVIAIREERPIIPGTPEDKAELVNELREVDSHLNAYGTLSILGNTLSSLEDIGTGEKAHFFLLELNPVLAQSSIRGFKQSESEKASNALSEVERNIEATSSSVIAVLVSVDNVTALRRAYPNYFLDTAIFAALLQQVLEEGL